MKKILLFFLFPFLNYSQTLDLSFDEDGIRTDQVTNIPSGQYAYDAAVQTDGKIVYVGRFAYPFTNSFAARYNTDGSKDTSFNQYGFKKFSSQGFQTLALQSNGSLLFAGRSEITRVLPNGDNDVTFNNSGSKNIVFNGLPINIKCISVQSDNKIVISGYVSSGNNDFVTVRLNNDGSYDTSFDTDGIVTIAFGSGNDEAFSHKIQNDGKIIVFGQSHNGINNDFALARINTDGTLDTTFGSGGKVITPIGSGNDFSRSGELLSDGRILLLGVSDGKFALTKYLANGTLDTSFSGDGKLQLTDNCTAVFVNNATTLHFMPKLKIASNGKILISGTSDSNFKIIRLLEEGTYDNSFGTNGVFIVNDGNDFSSFLAEKQDGTILSGGITSQTTPTVDIYTVKINEISISPVGSIEINTKNLYSGFDQFTVGTIQTDQSIILATTTRNSVNSTTKDVVIVTKFNPDGTTDLSYGQSGVLQIEFDSFIGSDKITKVLHLPDHSIILKGYTQLYKITPSGLVDTSFGTNGVLVVSNIDSDLSLFNDIVLSSDNKLLLTCDQSLSSPQVTQTAVIKLNLDGTKDTGFGTNGIVGYSFSNNTNDSEWPSALFQDSNNKIIVTSVSHLTSQTSSPKLCISRLNPNGTFDTSFGTNGIFIYEHSPAAISHTITHSSDGNYLINFSDPIQKKGHVVKVNTNGTVDSTFGLNGESTDLSDSFATSMILQADGKFIKAGHRNNQLSISRFNADGSLDTGFGINGEINTHTGFESIIETLQLQSDGKLLAIGNSFDGNYRHIIVLRYTDTTLGMLDLESNKNALLVYPNPIENSTTFEYTLTENEQVSITLFDLLGKEVKKIITNQQQHAGKHSLPISLEGMAAGNYILKIASGKGSQSLQLVKK